MWPPQPNPQTTCTSGEKCDLDKQTHNDGCYLWLAGPLHWRYLSILRNLQHRIWNFSTDVTLDFDDKGQKGTSFEKELSVYISALILFYELLNMCSMEMPIIVDVF